jgi:uncharacterized DUF497 family protein
LPGVSPAPATSPEITAGKFDFSVANQFASPLARSVRFEWDNAKAEANFAKHGIEFAFAIRVFSDPAQVRKEDARRDYGEARVNTIGSAGGALILCVTHTSREGITRIISARPASRKERKRYHE